MMESTAPKQPQQALWVVSLLDLRECCELLDARARGTSRAIDGMHVWALWLACTYPPAEVIDCLEQHAKDHSPHAKEVDPSAWGYMPCHCAHDLDAALAVASGRLLTIVNKAGVSLLWHEKPITLHPKCCEFYTACHHVYNHAVFGRAKRRAVGLTDGVCPADLGRAELQSLRQAHFPTALVEHVVVNAPTDRPGGLHCALVAAGWRLLLGVARDKHAKAAAMLAASTVHKWALTFWSCELCTDETLSWVASALPHTLEELRLNLSDSAATSVGGDAVLESVLLKLVHQPVVRLLQWLELSDCMLTGSIPTALGDCCALQVLILLGNELTGAIPSELGLCTALTRLNLSENALSGAIPDALGKLLRLKKLNLRDNRLSGRIPEALGELSALTKCELSWNCLAVQDLPELLCKRVASGKLKLRVDWLRAN